MRAKVKELEAKLSDMVEKRIREAEKARELKEKEELAKKEEMKAEARRKAVEMTRYYIDVDLNLINKSTFLKKVWKSEIKYTTTTYGNTTRMIVDSQKKVNKIYDIYKDRLEKEKRDVPKLSDISGVLKRSGMAKSKIK